MALVVGAAFGGLYFNGREAEGGEVVGTGAHVEFADVAGEGEAVGDEFGGDVGGEFEGPFVEVHVGMQAAGLFVLRGAFAGELDAVERTSGGSEKAEGVVVGAAEGLGLDDGGELGGREAERVLVVAYLVGRLAIDHGPFVQAEAAEEGGAVAGGGKQVAQPKDEGAALFRQGAKRDAVFCFLIPGAG